MEESPKTVKAPTWKEQGGCNYPGIELMSQLLIPLTAFRVMKNYFLIKEKYAKIHQILFLNIKFGAI